MASASLSPARYDCGACRPRQPATLRRRTDSLFQPDLAGFIQHAVATGTIAQVQTDRQLGLRKILRRLYRSSATFFIAGLLYLLRFERVDNLGAYTASRPETGSSHPI
jgi:hypothetical protein